MRSQNKLTLLDHLSAPPFLQWISKFLADLPPDRSADNFKGTLTACNDIVNKYRRGEISKVLAYMMIQKSISEMHRISPEDAEKGFKSFIRAIENHDTEVKLALKRDKGSKWRHATPESEQGDESDHGEDGFKKPKVDKEEFPWVKGESFEKATLSPSLSKTLELLKLFSVSPKGTK
jgi:hypothetical protein